MVTRLAVVLVQGESSVEVTYLTTFNRESTVPASLDESMWYPTIVPGENKDSKSVVQPEAQWASLRRKQTITANPVGCFFLPRIVNISDIL